MVWIGDLEGTGEMRILAWPVMSLDSGRIGEILAVDLYHITILTY